MENSWSCWRASTWRYFWSICNNHYLNRCYLNLRYFFSICCLYPHLSLVILCVVWLTLIFWYNLLSLHYGNADADHPIRFSLKTGTNTSVDFLKFFIMLLEVGFFTAGDILILDNARIHSAADILPIIIALAEEALITIRFMPKYSPELNPTELVHAWCKRHVKNNRIRGILSLTSLFSPSLFYLLLSMYFPNIFDCCDILILLEMCILRTAVSCLSSLQMRITTVLITLTDNDVSFYLYPLFSPILHIASCLILCFFPLFHSDTHLSFPYPCFDIFQYTHQDLL